eukprot:5308077-Amphidinium_carterae.1
MGRANTACGTHELCNAEKYQHNDKQNVTLEMLCKAIRQRKVLLRLVRLQTKIRKVATSTELSDQVDHSGLLKELIEPQFNRRV